jgi:hypothetical protein
MNLSLFESTTADIFAGIIAKDESGLVANTTILCDLLRENENSLYVTIAPIPRIVKILLDMNKVMTSPFKTRIVERHDSVLTETMITTTFESMFREIIFRENFHNVTVKDTNYVCNFHKESLLCHLILASIISLWYVINNDPTISDHECLIIATTALLHDIGKPATRLTGQIQIKDRRCNVTKFAGHGFVGGIILQKSFSPEFGFALNEWDDICRCTTIHMCGYHCTNSADFITQQKWCRLALESASVKSILVALSIADSLAKIQPEKISIVTSDSIIDDLVISSRPEFHDFITNVYVDKKIFKKLSTSGLCIVIMGASASGKTTLATNLLKFFTDRSIIATHISRDQVMLDIVCPILGLINDGMGETYAACYMYSHDEKNKHILNEIDTTVKSMISNCIVFGEVCIIDTVMALYRKQFNSYFSDDILSYEVLQIYIDRNTIHRQSDADRLGITLEKQIKLAGECSLENPLKKIDVASIASLISCTELWNMKRDVSNKSQATLTATVIWDDEKMFGYTHVEQLLTILASDMATGNVTKIDTMKMNVIDYVNHSFSLCETNLSISFEANLKIKFDAIVRRFNVQQFSVSSPQQFRGTPMDHRFFSIKYRDGINRLWRPTWARQCRGVCFYVTDDFRCIPAKYQLQRGAELMTGMLAQAKIASTQDISDAGKLQFLSDSQQQTCKILLAGENDGNITADITEKVDGSLAVVTFYFGHLAAIMTECVTLYGDDLAKAILKMFSKYGLVAVLSTQGTLMIGNDMQDYFVTSALESLGIAIPRVSLSTPTEVFELLGESWCEQVHKILTQLPIVTDATTISLCFESVCTGRTTAWGKLHTELAISYDKSMFLFLGASWTTNDEVVNVPHTMLKTHSVLGEPLFWNIRHATEVDQLMRGLEDVVYGKITSVDFLTKYPPTNECHDITQPLHPEGFVIFTVLGEILGLPNVDYNKLKLAAYYMGHKWHEENIKELYVLSKTAAHIFPMARAVGIFFSSIGDKLLNIAEQLHVLFTAPTESNIFIQGGILEGKALVAYSKETTTPDIRAKMIINAKSSSSKDAHCESNIFDRTLINIISSEFPAVITTSYDKKTVITSLKKLTMDIKPWLNYNTDDNSVPPEFTDILADPISYSGVGYLFFFIMSQTAAIDGGCGGDTII